MDGRPGVGWGLNFGEISTWEAPPNVHRRLTVELILGSSVELFCDFPCLPRFEVSSS